jgi:hypothetical protein
VNPVDFLCGTLLHILVSSIICRDNGASSSLCCLSRLFIGYVEADQLNDNSPPHTRRLLYPKCDLYTLYDHLKKKKEKVPFHIHGF